LEQKFSKQGFVSHKDMKLLKEYIQNKRCKVHTATFKLCVAHALNEKGGDQLLDVEKVDHKGKVVRNLHGRASIPMRLDQRLALTKTRRGENAADEGAVLETSAVELPNTNITNPMLQKVDI
jgi:hypothetical protein